MKRAAALCWDFTARSWYALQEQTELSPRTFWTFGSEFSPLTATRRAQRSVTLTPDTGRPVYSASRAVRVPGRHLPDARARRVPWSSGRSPFRGHAAASRDGHVSHADIGRDRHIPGAMDQLPEPVVIALLRPNPRRHLAIIGRSLPPLNSDEGTGGSPA